VFVSQISTTEAAERLGVGVARVHQRIADGSLPAVRVGSRWVIDEASLLPLTESRSPGRPLSLRSTRALVALSQADQYALGTFAPAELSRAKRRLHRLLTDPAPQPLLRSWFRNRAERRRYRASPRDLPDLRDDNRLMLSGVSHPESGLSAHDLVEGYLTAAVVDAVVEAHLLSPVAADRDANVILHVADGAIGDEIGPLLLAADLAEHRRPREDARAARFLQEIARA
jgi:excisionase family DNA binding protein